MSPVVTHDTLPRPTSDVVRLVAQRPGRPLTWAALTVTRPGEAFANVCIGSAVPTPDRLGFLAAVFDVVAGLGARHLLAVLASEDEPLVARLGPACRVLGTTAIGATSLVRVVLSVVSPRGPLALGSCVPCQIRVERLPSVGRASRPSGAPTAVGSTNATSSGASYWALSGA